MAADRKSEEVKTWLETPPNLSNSEYKFYALLYRLCINCKSIMAQGLQEATWLCLVIGVYF